MMNEGRVINIFGLEVWIVLSALSNCLDVRVRFNPIML